MAENITTSSTDNEDKKRRRKALLAGGLVLGLGAAVTLAAWSDNIFANGTFNTATFELQGATDNSSFADYDEAPGADLTFELDATKMSPNQTVYAPFTVATSTATDVPGTFTLAKVTHNGGGLQGVLTYSIYAVEGDGTVNNCSPDTAPITPVIWSGAATADAPTQADVNLSVGANQNAPRQAMCFAVTMGNQDAVESAIDADTDGNHQTNIVWQFTGKSVEQ